jgi:hypothetical protein
MQAALLGDLDVINGINHLLGHAILNNVVPTAVRKSDDLGAQLQALVGCVDGNIATARDGHTLALHSTHKLTQNDMPQRQLQPVFGSTVP